MSEHRDTEHSALAPESSPVANPTILRRPTPAPRELERKASPTLGDIYDVLWENRRDEQQNRCDYLDLYGQVQHDIGLIRVEVRGLMEKLETVDKRLLEGDARFGQIETTHVEALDRVTVILGKLQMRFTDQSDELGGTTILIVEDDPPLQRLVAQICQRAGATTITCSTTEEARAALELIKAPAAASVDILLGVGDDGFDLVRQIATKRQDIGVVILTGGLTDRQRREATALRVRCVGKPFDNETLVAALAAARDAARQ